VRVQPVTMPSGLQSWTVIGDGFRPIEPIEHFLTYLTDLDRSPGTVRLYAYNLKSFFEFLIVLKITWDAAELDHVSRYAGHLRERQLSNAAISTHLAAVGAFYDYQLRNGIVLGSQLTIVRDPHGKRRGLLSHTTARAQTGRAIAVRVSQPMPKTLSVDQVQALLDGCRNLRDRFLLAMLYETGCRIGGALGLRHADMMTWDRRIRFTARTDNANGARFKGTGYYVVDISSELVHLYSQYMFEEYEEYDSDYVFINLWRQPLGHAMNYSTVEGLVERLEARTGITFNVHMLRHTHATELLTAGVAPEVVAKRLNHASPETTMTTYAHFSPEHLKNGLSAWWETARAQVAA
jgi:integrase/recombinase XerD